MSLNSAIRKTNTAIRFFLYVLVFWLPYSPAVIEVSVIICLLLWLVKRALKFIARHREDVGPKESAAKLLTYFAPAATPLNRPIAFFLAVCLLSIASSAFWGQSFHNFLTKTLEWFIVYFLVVEVMTDKKHIAVALGIFTITALATGLDSMIQFHITNKDIFLGHMIEPGSRATAGFKTANSLGGYLTIAIPWLAAWVTMGRQKILYRIYFSFVLFVLLWSCVITFSRGAWIGLFFGGMFLLVFVFNPGKRTQFYFSMGILGMIVIAFLAMIIMLMNSEGVTLLGRFYTVPWRLNLWKESLPMIADKPFFGHGINTYMAVFQSYRPDMRMGPTYAHNCFIQLAAETGLMGLICFAWIFGRLFHWTLANARNVFEKSFNSSVCVIGLLSGIFAFLIHSFFDTNFYTLQLSVYLWLMVGLLVSLNKLGEDSKAQCKIIQE